MTYFNFRCLLGKKYVNCMLQVGKWLANRIIIENFLPIKYF